MHILFFINVVRLTYCKLIILFKLWFSYFFFKLYDVLISSCTQKWDSLQTWPIILDVYIIYIWWKFYLLCYFFQIETWLDDWVNKTGNDWSNNAKVITKSWLNKGLKPRCITRDLKWGVPVPLKNFEQKVKYIFYLLIIVIWRLLFFKHLTILKIAIYTWYFLYWVQIFIQFTFFYIIYIFIYVDLYSILYL